MSDTIANPLGYVLQSMLTPFPRCPTCGFALPTGPVVTCDGCGASLIVKVAESGYSVQTAWQWAHRIARGRVEYFLLVHPLADRSRLPQASADVVIAGVEAV